MAEKFSITGKVLLTQPDNLNEIAREIKSRLQTSIPLQITGATEAANDAIRKVKFAFSNSQVPLNFRAVKDFSTIVQDVKKGLKGVEVPIGVRISNLDEISRQISQQIGTKVVPVEVRINSNGAKDIDRISTAMEKTAKATDVASNNMSDFGRQTAITIRRFGAYTLVTASFFELTQAISEGVSEAIEFEHELTKIRQVTGRSIAGLRGLTDQIDHLSTSLGVSSTELLNASQVLAQAGFSASETAIAMETLAMADLSPTFDSISETGEGSIAVLRQFNLGVKDLYSTIGSLNAVSAAYAVESSDLIKGAITAGGAFAAAGGSVEEFFSLFTSVRSTTRASADSIATGLKTISTRLQRGSTQNFLKELGIDLKFTGEEARRLGKEGTFVGVYESIRRINEAIQGIGSNDPRFAQIAEELGGFRQIDKVIPLLQQFELAEKARGVAIRGTDSLTKDAVIAQESLANQIKKTREELQEMLRTFTQDESFKSFIKLSLNLARSFIEVAESLSSMLAPLIGLSAGAIVRPAIEFRKKFVPTLLGQDKVPAFAGGGSVPGIGNKDDVPAVLTPGEFVLRKDIVKKVGLSNLERLNSGQVQAFAEGGAVGNVKDVLSNPIMIGGALIGLQTLGDNLGEFGKTLESATQSVFSAGLQFVLFKSLLGAAGPDMDKFSKAIETSKSELNEILKPSLRDNRRELKDLQVSGSKLSRPSDPFDYMGRAEYNADVSENRASIENKKSAIKADRERIRTNLEVTRSAKRQIRNTDILNTSLAGTVAGLALFSSVLDGIANKELESLKVTETNRSSGTAFAASRAASSGATGAIFGTLGATQLAPLLGLGPAGVAAAAAITGLAFAAKGLNDGFKEFDKEVRSIKLDKISNNLSNALASLESGDSSASLQANNVIVGVRALSAGLKNESDPGLRDNINSSIESSISGIQTFIEQTKKSSVSLQDFQNAIPNDVLEFFAKQTSTSLGELTEKIRTSIEAQEKYAENFKATALAQQAFESRIRTEIAITKAIRNTAESLKEFDGSLQNLTTGGFSSDISNTLSTQLSDLGGISDLNKFTSDLGSFASVFGKAGSSLTSGTVDAAKAIEALPGLFLKLRSQDPLGEGGEVLTDIRQELSSMGIDTLISDTILNNVQPLLGPENQDSQFFEAVRTDLSGVIDGIAKSLTGIGGTLESANDRISKELSSFSSGIVSYVEAIDKASNRRMSVFDSRTTLQRIAGGDDKNLDFNRQQSIMSDRQGFATGGRDANQVVKDLITAQSELQKTTEQLNQATNPDQQKRLIEEQGKHAIAIREANRALDFLADASQRTAVLQDRLADERQQREGRNSIAEKITFGGAEANTEISKNITLARTLASAGGDITTIAQSSREGLKSFLDQLGDTTIGGLGGLSGNDIKDMTVKNSLKEAGISGKGITEAGTKESKILDDIRTIFKESQGLEMKRAKLEETNATGLVSKLSSAFDVFIADLKTTLKTEQVRAISQNITSLQGDLSQANKVRNAGKTISALSGGVDPKVVLNNFESINQSFQELQSSAMVANRARAKFKGDENKIESFLSKSIGANTTSPSGISSFMSSMSEDQLNMSTNKILKDLESSIGPEFAKVIRDKIDAGAFSGIDEFSVTKGTANSQERLINEFQSLISSTAKEFETKRFSANERLSELSKNVGGRDNASTIFNNRELIGKVAANLPEKKNFENLDRTIKELTTKIQVLTATRQGFATGGIVGGLGNSDSVPAMLTPGEFVIRKDAVKKHGVRFLETINRGKTNFADGGIVQSSNGGMSGASLDRFNAAVNQFTVGVDKLSESLRLIPSFIEMRGQHKVEVIVNGAQVLNNIMPSIANLVKSEIHSSLNKLIKDRFPEQGPLL